MHITQQSLEEGDEVEDERYDEEEDLSDLYASLNSVLSEILTSSPHNHPSSEAISTLQAARTALNTGLTREQIVVRRAVGFTGRREGDEQDTSERLWGRDEGGARYVRLANQDGRRVTEYCGELMR